MPLKDKITRRMRQDAVAMAWVAVGAMGSYLRGREILRSPLFYIVAVLYDLSDGS